jgi:prolyl-tRNA synthetase
VAVPALLDAIQQNIYQRALKFRQEMTTPADSYDAFKKVLEEKGGFIAAHWDGTAETEQKIKEETKATIRCIPLDAKEEAGKCVYSGRPSSRRVLFAMAY